MKALFSFCTYAADIAYQSWLENHQYREKADLPPLSPPQPPPRFDNLPSLSNTDFEGAEDEEEEDEIVPKLTRHLTCFTSTSHHGGRAVVSDDDGGGDCID